MKTRGEGKELVSEISNSGSDFRDFLLELVEFQEEISLRRIQFEKEELLEKFNTVESILTFSICF